VTLRLGQTKVEVGVDGRGRAVADLVARGSVQLTAAYSGNGRYGPARARARG
jgi:hypothetical protein